MLPQFPVLPCGSFFLVGEQNGKWRKGQIMPDNIEIAWAPVENSSRGQRGIRDCKALKQFMEKN